MFPNRVPAHLGDDAAPRLLVVVDTEEEFDWSADPDRAADSVRSMRAVERAQRICDRYGIRPCYVIDYPVATQADGYEPLRDIHDDGRCIIGAHLHPWVNPPFDEPLTRANTFPGNLPAALEREKLRILSEEIGTRFGAAPNVYKAGRYGYGAHTTQTLEALGFDVDVSLCPPLDQSSEGGPDYTREQPDPFWYGAERRLLELPVTGGFVGAAGRHGAALYPHAARLRALRVPGVLARLRLLDRLTLSPEGFSHEEHVRLTRALFARGLRVFTWSFHSPSLEPGHTPYVRDEGDLRRFLDAFERFFDFFFGELGGVATTPDELRTLLEPHA